MMGISSGLEVVGTDGLDADEKESGTQAFSCLLYQYGAQIDAKLLCVLWAFGVAAPRLAKLAIDKKKEKPVTSPPAAHSAPPTPVLKAS